MTEEELFKKNFPQFCTEKGGCLSPFYDLFEAGVEIATAELNKEIIQSLTKENAELKRRLDNIFNSDCWASEKLTKAKEIIREYMNWADWKGSNCPSFANICIKAEQFLKEK